jgi:hypothetical protein
MTLRDYESVQRRNGITVRYCKRQLVLSNDSLALHLTKQTIWLSVGVCLPNSSKISVVAVPLHCVAAITQCLEVAYVICAPKIPGHDVVNFERFFIRRYSTQLTTKPCSFEYFVFSVPDM